MTIRNDDGGRTSARAKKRALEQQYAKSGGRPEQALTKRPPRGNTRPSKASMGGGSSHDTVDLNRSYDLSADWDNDHNNRSFNGSNNRSFNGSANGSGNLSGHIGKARRGRKGDARSIDSGMSGMSGMSGSNGSLSLSRPPKQRTKVKLRDTDRILRRSNHGRPADELERAPSRGRQMARQGSGMVRSRSSDGASVASVKSTKTSATAGSRGLSVERTGSKRSASAEPTNRRNLSRDASTRGQSKRSVSQEPTAGRRPARPVQQNSSRKGMGPKQTSARPGVGSKQVSARPGLGRQGSSRRGLGSRQGSARSGISSSTGSVRSGMSRQTSGRPGLKRQLSDRPGKMAMQRELSELSERALREQDAAKNSKRAGFFGKKPKSARIQTGAGSRFEYSSGKRRFIPRIEKAPPKSLVLIWLVVTIELMMDLVTTIISFVALVQEDDCCDEPIQLGFIPVTATVPFFLLIVAEVAFLARAVKLTMCPTPPELERRYMEEDDRWCITRWICCCLRWNARALFGVINWLVLLNPFFGAVVAWMLLYQSSKTECFVVLGLEGASLFLHFLSIYLEGERQTRLSMTIHLLPVLPFLASVILILVYLQQGGVCYLVADTKFWYDGCRVCEDGLPPVDNVCVINETVWNNYTDPATGEYVTVAAYNIKEVELDLNPLFATQDTYCGEGPNATKFCFFTY